ncbi:MAG: AraC family transcriptional regulator [Solirubrobacteraceae bacterium]|jgi:AraC family transcriptional regulator of adaptative response / DNA-3-methyladenine glycosylase II|nr:AraC family transcriptional regulator [Solirubrobacteraceae bacterium]
MDPMLADFDHCYRAVGSRDARFDGWFFTAVTSTRIYCRPSCPAKTPKPENVRFYLTAAAAQQDGFRACLRCRPDAAPGSPEWLGRADVAARAVRLIHDGAVDRDGVAGLARRLGYSERQLHRVLMAEVGTGALSLARAQRAQTARVLLQTTDLPITQVALSAGFSSLRQFNETIRAVFARTPTDLRRRASPGFEIPADQAATTTTSQSIAVRLAHRRPFAADRLFDFLAHRAVAGIESYDGVTYRRSLRLPNGHGTVSLTPATDGAAVDAVFLLDDLRDLTAAIARSRHLLNLDADPVAVDHLLGSDPLLGPLVAETPGLRVPGAVDGFELAVRAIVGQQVSVAGARTVLGALVRAAGDRIGDPVLPITHSFPTPEALLRLATDDPAAFPMPASRRRALVALAEALLAGDLAIDPGADPHALRNTLIGLRGVGPWTAAYVGMRALGDPDAFLPTDLAVRRAIAQLGAPNDPISVARLGDRWRPWRAYAVVHLWGLPPRPGRLQPVSSRPREATAA